MSITALQTISGDIQTQQLNDNFSLIGQEFTAHLADYSSLLINVKYPPTGYVPAVGDGVTDDTNALQALFTDFNTIFIPEGNYLTNSLSADDIYLFGAPEKTIIKIISDGVNTNGIQLTGNIYVSNIIFQQSNILNTIDAAIEITETEKTRIKNCIFTNTTGVWVKSDANTKSNIIVDECLFDSCPRTGLSIASSTIPTENVKVTNTTFLNCGTNAISQYHGAYVVATNIAFNNCTFKGTLGGYGLNAYVSSENASYEQNNIKVINCTFTDNDDTTGGDCYVSGYKSVYAYNTNIIGCTFEPNRIGIAIKTNSSFAIIGNTINMPNNSSIGIVIIDSDITHPNMSGTISGNSFIGDLAQNSDTVVPKGEGTRVGVSGGSVGKNSINISGNSFNSLIYGINGGDLSGRGGIYDCFISSNAFKNNTTDIYDLENPNASTKIINNLGILDNFSVTYDPPSLDDNTQTTTIITCTGARMGDLVDSSFSINLNGVIMTAYVSASDTVTILLRNNTGAVRDLASGTLRVRITKR